MKRLTLFLPVVLSSALSASAALPTKPVLFVTQVPVADEVNSRNATESFLGVGGAFSNHLGSTKHCGRGGALMIRYSNATVRNLTKAAGFGVDPGDGLVPADLATKQISVRQPHVHWSGTKAIFSMVVGAPTAANQNAKFFWQLYEITNFASGQTPVITKVPHQPANFNNVSPCYGTDERIIFTSDQPRDGTSSHLYPQREEYLLLPTVTGLWSLDPVSGDSFLLQHSPSGAFTPIIDSAGRVIFTRWDHLSRDPEAVTDRPLGPGDTYLPSDNGTFNYADESAAAAVLPRFENYPEPRNFDHSGLATLAAAGIHENGNSINHFFPWMITEDGTGEETLNHVGRHELFGGFTRSFTDDPKLVDFSVTGSPRISNLYQVRESPTQPGVFYGVNAPDVGDHAAGQIISLNGGPGVNPESMPVTYITPSLFVPFPPQAPLTTPVDIFKCPLPVTDLRVPPTVPPTVGAPQDALLVAAHTTATITDSNQGTAAAPQSRFAFRLRTLKLSGTTFVPDTALTSGFAVTAAKPFTYWDGATQISYTGPLWELDPVEVVARTKPSRVPTVPIAGPEQQIFSETGVNLTAFQNFLRANNLAVSVSRDVTTRDRADKQQPFNLKIASSGHQTVAAGFVAGDKVYPIQFMQYMQADQLRGLTMVHDIPPLQPAVAGRRILATPLHESAAVLQLPPVAGAPVGSVQLGADGSQAAIVPARRAITWHLTDANGASVVKERYWITFQPGEIRMCTSCHGLNTTNQTNVILPNNQSNAPQNPPEALRTLLNYWKTIHPPFEQWQYEKFASSTAATAQPNVDPDNDGLTNLVEYAFNTNPSAPDALPLATPFTEIDPSDQQLHLAFTYHRRKAPRDITYHVEVGTALDAWQEGAAVATEFPAVDDGNGVTESVKVRLAASFSQADRLFVRVRVSIP